MCGFAGEVSLHGINPAILTRMSELIANRGPDDEGMWINGCSNVGLAHRRLSILDTSSAGRQPMMSKSKRYIMVYNGEIYNHLSIRLQLKETRGEGFVGSSDTETILACLDAFGFENMLTFLDGMFAMAIYDRESDRLYLARDRFGEKPLYYAFAGDSLIFASEIKSLTAHPKVRKQLDFSSLYLYLRHCYISAPYTIFENIKKIEPASYLIVDCRSLNMVSEGKYWSSEIIPSAAIGPIELRDKIHEQLRDSVSSRMISDRSLGVFLSGGIDSSLIACLAQSSSGSSFNTYTIAFEETGYDESKYAAATASYLGTRHNHLTVTAKDALDTLPYLPMIWDEPFSDSSQIPTLLLCKFASKSVKVALSGDGGDELFCGYNRYSLGHKLHLIAKLFPRVIRETGSNIIDRIPPETISSLAGTLPILSKYPAIGDRLHKIARILRKYESPEFYLSLVSCFEDPGELVKGIKCHHYLLSQPAKWPLFKDFRETMMFLDTNTYLPGDILTKTDRASMFNSMECRSPFLNHNLYELLWQFNLSSRIPKNEQKWILKSILSQYLPTNLFDRPKQGFGIPLESWITGPLLEWVNDLLSPTSLNQQGIFNEPRISQMIEEHISGKRRWHHQIWNLLIFQLWYRENF
jgi:asparagine synthase (glutamine-hydrolysing)